jgi:hypothetical protein
MRDAVERNPGPVVDDHDPVFAVYDGAQDESAPSEDEEGDSFYESLFAQFAEENEEPE